MNYQMDLTQQYIEKYLNRIGNVDLIKLNGKVTDVIGLVIVSVGPNVSLGEVCTIAVSYTHLDVYKRQHAYTGSRPR